MRNSAKSLILLLLQLLLLLIIIIINFKQERSGCKRFEEETNERRMGERKGRQDESKVSKRRDEAR